MAKKKRSRYTVDDYNDAQANAPALPRREKAEKVDGRHYDFAGTSAIGIIEAVVSRKGFTASQIFCIGNALKYLLRCGNKPSESIADDLKKAKNYLHRAITGEWEAK